MQINFSQQCFVLIQHFCLHNLQNPACVACGEAPSQDSIVDHCLVQLHLLYHGTCESAQTATTTTTPDHSFVDTIDDLIHQRSIVIASVFICFVFICTPWFVLYLSSKKNREKDLVDDDFSSEDDYWFTWNRLPAWRFKRNPFRSRKDVDVPLSEQAYTGHQPRYGVPPSQHPRGGYEPALIPRTDTNQSTCSNTGRVFIHDHPYRPRTRLGFAQMDKSFSNASPRSNSSRVTPRLGTLSPTQQLSHPMVDTHHSNPSSPKRFPFSD